MKRSIISILLFILCSANFAQTKSIDSLKIILRTWFAEGANETLDQDSSNEPVPDDVTLLKSTWNSLSLHIFEPKCLKKCQGS